MDGNEFKFNKYGRLKRGIGNSTCAAFDNNKIMLENYLLELDVFPLLRKVKSFQNNFQLLHKQFF